jgi:methionyl aminopeptidase
MPIIIKSRREIEMMRRAGRLACLILEKMRRAVVPGVTTFELNEVARRELESAGAIGLSKNYPTYKPGEGYPAETCISVNEQVVHGIPGPRQLREGDIVTLDLALSLDGFCSDTAATVPVGMVNPEVRRLLDVTKETLAIAINNVRPGQRWSNIARLMQFHVSATASAWSASLSGTASGARCTRSPRWRISSPANNCEGISRSSRA